LTEPDRNSEPPPAVVLDTSVAVKWYLPADLHDEAINLRLFGERFGEDMLPRPLVEARLAKAATTPQSTPNTKWCTLHSCTRDQWKSLFDEEHNVER
jgi:hypothetical protein